MSVSTLCGLKTHLPQRPREQAAFVAELALAWTGDDPQRLRALAALVLHEEGWTLRRIALALGTEPSGGTARRLIAQAKRGVRRLAATRAAERTAA